MDSVEDALQWARDTASLDDIAWAAELDDFELVSLLPTLTHASVSPSVPATPGEVSKEDWGKIAAIVLRLTDRADLGLPDFFLKSAGNP